MDLKAETALPATTSLPENSLVIRNNDEENRGNMQGN